MKMSRGNVDSWLADPPKDIQTFLLYGYEEALSEYRAYTLRKMLQKKHHCSVIDLEKLPQVGSLRDIMCQTSLLPESIGSTPIVFLKNAKDSHNHAVVSVLDARGGYLIMTAGTLRSSSKLRTSVENHPRGVAIPCYTDTPENLEDFIKSLCTKEGRKLQEEALHWLTDHLGSYRGIIEQEIKTLFITFSDLKKNESITLDHVQQCLQSLKVFFLEDVAQSAMIGNMYMMEHGLTSIFHEKIPPDRLLGVLITRMFTILSIQEKGREISWERLRPPIHFSRRPAYQRDSKLWDKDTLITTTSALQKTQGACRLSPDCAEILCHSALLEVAQKARQLLRGE